MAETFLQNVYILLDLRSYQVQLIDLKYEKKIWSRKIVANKNIFFLQIFVFEAGQKNLLIGKFAMKILRYSQGTRIIWNHHVLLAQPPIHSTLVNLSFAKFTFILNQQQKWYLQLLLIGS